MKNIVLAKLLKIEVLLLSVGLLLLITHNFIVAIGLNAQMIILLTLVFIIGVPHGALDFLVDEQNEVTLKQTFSLKKFVSVYLLRLFVFSLFWMLPWFAFSLFILFSIYHFGETDMYVIMKPKKTSIVLYIAYGAFILGILLLTHLSEIGQTLPAFELTIKNSVVYHFLDYNKMLLLSILAAFFLGTLVWQKQKNNIFFDGFQVAQFLLLVVIISLLPLLLAFTFYFALWHSILSVRNIFSYFKTFNSEKKFNTFCSKSVLFSLLALVSIVILYFALHYYMPKMNLLFALLVILSVLTLPHLSVMHNMYKNINGEKKILPI